MEHYIKLLTILKGPHLKALTKEDFQHCFNQRKKRMERCVAREGEYIEGEHSNVK